MNILQINAQPDYNNDKHTSVRLLNSGDKFLRNELPEANIETLNLYAPQTNLPRVDADFVNGAPISPAQRKLLDQFKNADWVFIYSPLHNFNINSRLKDYIDNILIAKETFKYTENGSVGLLNNSDIKIAYIQVSGSDYEHDLRYVNADFAPKYLRTIFNFMGINEMELIRAQGMDLLGADREGIFEKSQSELKNYIKDNC